MGTGHAATRAPDSPPAAGESATQDESAAAAAQHAHHDPHPDSAATPPHAAPADEAQLQQLSQRLHDHERHHATSDAPPVFWNRHNRSVSSASYQSLNTSRPAAIRLEDHSEEDHAQAQSCWARSVTIDDYVVVSGPTGIGAYVVWHCTVRMLDGGDLSIRKRYSEFDRLREHLVHAFPHAESQIPELPRKSIVSRFRPRFLEQRKNGLGHFLNCVLLNPVFASSPMLKDFIFY